MAKFVIETKGNSVTLNALMSALVFAFGSQNIVSVKHADQQSVQADGAYCACPKDMYRQYQSAEVCDVCQKPRR